MYAFEKSLEEYTAGTQFLRGSEERENFFFYDNFCNVYKVSPIQKLTRVKFY